MYLLIFAICFAFLLSISFLYRYGNVARQHPLVSVSVVIAWSFSFLIVFTIPLDVTATVYRKCLHDNNITTESNDTSKCHQPWGMVSDEVFPNIWRVIYWSSQFLTWLILPLMQSYLKAGDFSVQGKLRSALIDNAVYYGTYLIICGFLLIYIAFQPNIDIFEWDKLKAIASSASNTWGLFLLVLLLGYALVEIPRSLYNNSITGYTLQHAYFKLSKLSSDKAEAEENAEDVLESLQSVNMIVPSHHPLRSCVDEIMRKVPTELMEKARRTVRDVGSNAIPSEKALIRLHRQVIKSLQILQRTEALWNLQVEKILYLEDIEMNFLGSPPFRHELSSPRNNCQPTLQWYWECVIKTPFLKILAGATAIMSILVVWSELTFFSSYPLSFFAIILNIARVSYDFVTIEIFSMLTLCYLCYCAYSTIFRIKFLNLYYLAPHHQTNEHSLLFSGMLLCRLTPPLCLNFLGLMHMDSHVIKQRTYETFYTQIMGHMDVLGIIANGFNIYFPMLMVAICAATWFSLGSRILNALGFQQFMANDEISSELVQEGRDLMVREKRKRQRNESSSRRRDFTLRDVTTSTPRGLLREGSGNNVGYNTNANAEDLSPEFGRSLSQEIQERFGASTDVNFRPDYDDQTQSRPRNIFDDV